MAAKKKAKTVELYDVRLRDGGPVAVIGVSLEAAQDERDRLNREARRPNEFGQPQGMHMGVVMSYEIVSKSGLVV